ncbi:MAG: hypothetical protein WA182_13850 [Candidatus Sulfotelmatobacter sp.]|jgi:hypothetical protein
MKKLILIMFISVAALAFGKDKPTVTIQIVDSQASTREFTYTTPGTEGTSNTTCNTNGTADTSGNATSNGDNTSYNGSTNLNANTNCTTTSTPATPAQAHVISIAQENVHAIMPDGSHVALWCQAGWRRCANLRPGKYTAEIDGGSVRINAFDLSQKVHKIKYKDVGGW